MDCTINYAHNTTYVTYIYRALSLLEEAIKSIYKVITCDKVLLFQLLINTKMINKDINFIQNYDLLISTSLWNDTSKCFSFIHLGQKYNSWNICKYLLSLPNLLLYHKPAWNIKKNFYETNASTLITSWMNQAQTDAQSGNMKDARNAIECIELLLKHPNFDHWKFKSHWKDLILHSAVLTLKPSAIINDNDIKDEDEKKADAKNGEDFVDVKPEIIKLLLDNGMSDKRFINYISDRDGQTALHVACSRKDVRTVDMLLKCKNIDVNETDSLGYTPLLTLCSQSDQDTEDNLFLYATIAEKLLKFDGCDAFTMNNQNETCLMMAIYRHNDLIVNCIRQHLTKKYNQNETEKKKVQQFLKVKCQQGDARAIAFAHNRLEWYNLMFQPLE